MKSQAASEKVTPSIFAGGLDKDGYPYIARVYWSHALQVRYRLTPLW